MGSQWNRDSVYVRAIREGYRSRAAFKLKEIVDRFHPIRESDNVLDLGAAQVAGSRSAAASPRERCSGSTSHLSPHLRG